MIKKRQGGKVVKITYDDGTSIDVKYNHVQDKKEEPIPELKSEERKHGSLPTEEDLMNIMELPVALPFDEEQIPPPILDDVGPA